MVPPRIAFLGAGRLARGLALAFARGGLNVAAVASRSPESAGWLAQRLSAEGCQASALSMQAAVDTADLVFITVPDDSIAATAALLQWRSGVAAVHCSGATEVSALDAARRSGAATGGFHPMQVFTDPEAAAASLPGCTVSIEADEPLFSQLRGIAEAIGCRALQLPPGSRARYHASGNYAAAFINVLLREASFIWQSFGMSEADAVQALLPLVKGTIASVEAQGLARGMAGPVSRGDVGTVQSHVDSLARVSDRTLDFYCELARRMIPLALERGSIDAVKAAELERVLGGKTGFPRTFEHAPK